MLTISNFIGEIPIIKPRNLPDNAAQIALNCTMVDGDIVPIRQPRDYRKLATGNVFFFKHKSTWFEYNKIVNVVSAPIAENRLYMTGDGVPKIITDASVIYPLAVRAPQEPLVAAVTGTPDPRTQETIVYAYTYVTAYDEESEPSPLSNEVLRSPGMDVTLTGFVAPPTDRNYNRIRIYRSKTGSTGVTDLFFIDEAALPVPAPSYIDNPEETPLQEAIQSVSYNPPPDDLQGIISLPNGMLAGFVGNKLYFSEPFLPHAWPQKYALTTNFDIVGLGAFGRSIAIMTTGQPEIATGIRPDQMAMERIEVNFPCINSRGIVDMGYGVAYPSPDGLVVISNSGAQLTTLDVFTREQWQQLNPETIVAAHFDGRYAACYSYVDNAGTTKSGMALLDLSGRRKFISRADVSSNYLFFDLSDAQLYFFDNGIAKAFDDVTMPFMQMTWRSKEIVLSGPINFGAAQIDSKSTPAASVIDPEVSVEDATLVADPFPATVVKGDTASFPTGPTLQTKVYADSNLVRTFADVNKIARLPGGFMSRAWEIEVSGWQEVSAIYMAWSPSELYVGAK